MLIEQLLEQDYDEAAYEVLIVDDGSTDGTRDYLKALQSENLRVLFGDRNQGRAVSRNRGISAATGDIIIMIDGDHTVKQDYLSVHARRHEKERCVIVGKSVFAPRSDLNALNHYLNHCGAEKLPVAQPIPGRYFLTRNCSLPRELLISVGMFDEAFKVWGGEDLDLGVRLQDSGVPIYGEPMALAIHHHHRSVRDLMRQQFVYGRDSIPLLLKKHNKLFYELNLDRWLSIKTNPSRFSAVYRLWIRLSFLPIFYYPLLYIAICFGRFKLPRIVFDYLHLRQYSKGYRKHMCQSRKGDVPHGGNH